MKCGGTSSSTFGGLWVGTRSVHTSVSAPEVIGPCLPREQALWGHLSEGLQQPAKGLKSTYQVKGGTQVPPAMCRATGESSVRLCGM